MYSRRVVLAGVVTWLAALAGAAAHAQDFSRNYRVESWDERQGLPSGRVWAISQDADGYLWLGTEAGLLRFDGVAFERWTAAEGASLPEESIVFSLYGARGGSLWLGFQSGGIGRIRQGRLEVFEADPTFGDGPVQFIVEDGSGTTWAGDPDGIYRFGDGRWSRVNGQFGLPNAGGYFAYQDRTGTLWLSTSAGVFVRRANSQTFQAAGFTRPEVRFTEDTSGQLWGTDPMTGYSPLDGSRRQRPSEVGTGQVIVRDGAGTIWLGTGGQGLWRVAGGEGGERRVERVTVAHGLSSDVVRSAFVDRDGNVWIGTDSGLNRISSRRIRPVDDLPFSLAIATTPDGSIWVASNDGLVQIDGQIRRRFGPADGLPSQFVRALFTDQAGTLWVATNRGVARRRGTRFETVLVDDAALARVIALAVDTKGTLWLCDRIRGAYVWRDGGLNPVPLPDGVTTGQANFVFVDRRDRVWIGYPPSLVTMQAPDGEVTTYRLPRSIGAAFTAVFEDSRGALWIGGTRGVARLHEGRSDAVAEPTPLPGYGVFAISEDSAGGLWLGVSSGILRLQADRFEQAARTPAALGYEYYDASDGLVGVPTRRGFPGAARSADGTLWFITSRGASTLRPDAIESAGPAAMVRIERVSVDDRPLPVTTAGSLPAGASRLLVEYTAINLTSATKDRFRYRLHGVDAGWVEAGTRREAFYPNLRSGAYRFEVARLGSGEGAESATWEFVILPMFYETWWFIGACVLAAAALAWAAWELRLRTLRRQFAVVFGERARMGRELHDTLLQTLVAIALHFDELAATLGDAHKPAVEQLRNLRRHLELAVVEARHMVWDLRSGTLAENGLPQVLREAGERIFEGKATQFSMSVQGTPRPGTREIEQHLLRIAQEALRNAARYAEASSVRLALAYRDDGLTLEVADNGRGLPSRDRFGDALDHYGFRIMNERAQQIGATFRVDTTPGDGTHVRVDVPLPKMA